MEEKYRAKCMEVEQLASAKTLAKNSKDADKTEVKFQKSIVAMKQAGV